ncbi:LEAFY-like protein [Senna tora]|uniref:Floricaula/leafy-like transcription factor n=1 Tax=Senna tora TaxID=362788 RepID=A0A835C761_9FABA|nr:LEAFY-like protein [Senna tora]
MDPDALTATIFKWDPRTVLPPITRPSSLLLDFSAPPPDSAAAAVSVCPPTRGLEELFHAYGIRYLTVSKIAELGFTASTLVDMKDQELDDMMNSLSHIFRWDLLVGERYGIKAAVRAERRRLDDNDDVRRRSLVSTNALDALSQEEVYCERQREHPFIVTEPGEVARGKKNGLDYLFHLYDQCRHFLIQVQTIAKNRGDKCPTKVTNQVFRYAKKAGASYINKPKMRHYVHCYALHCLDEQVSNELRRVFKERGENVGVWRQACYKPLVAIAAPQAWDIDAIFNAHPRLSIWYVPTKLRQLCHAARNAAAGGSGSGSGGQLPF